MQATPTEGEGRIGIPDDPPGTDEGAMPQTRERVRSGMLGEPASPPGSGAATGDVPERADPIHEEPIPEQVPTDKDQWRR